MRFNITTQSEGMTNVFRNAKPQKLTSVEKKTHELAEKQITPQTTIPKLKKGMILGDLMTAAQRTLSTRLLSIRPSRFGCHCWLVQQCEAGTRVPLLDKPGSATQR